MKKKNLVVAIYNHPETYPPTLNAIEYLSEEYDKIYIVYRNINYINKWEYPKNVTQLTFKDVLQFEQIYTAPLYKKLLHFAKFTFLFFKTIIKVKADTVLLYDSIPVFSYRIFNKFINKPRILWYHNHDVTEIENLNSFKKYSLVWWAWKSESWIISYLDYFSLPSVERKKYFKLDKLKGKFLFLPNYPCKKVYDKIDTFSRTITNNVVNISYQGSVGDFHGFEEIIKYVLTSNDYNYNLHLKGYITNNYKKKLLELSRMFNVEDKLFIYGYITYAEMIHMNTDMHIGIAIYTKNDAMNNTIATASNKIYEYAASGMPVLIFDNAHFREVLNNNKWIFFTNLEKNSLLNCIKEIVTNFNNFSIVAKTDFNDKYNFEYAFQKVKNI